MFALKRAFACFLICEEFRELSTFLQVAKLQSFSKAAKVLGYSQAAVTIQIKQLEQELGAHLFDRIGKQTTLTHQGSVFYEYAASIIRDMAQAKDAVSHPQKLTGRLCIGTIESICASIFPNLLTEYHKRHPEVNISIRTDSPDQLLEQINSNQLDLVYFMDKRVYDVKWEKVLEEPEDIVFAATPDHPLAQRDEPLELDEILSYPFVLTEKDASYRLLLEQYLAAMGKHLDPYLEIGNTDFILQFLRQNTGVTFLPHFTVERSVKEGYLRILPVKRFAIRTWRQLLYHKDKWVTREMAEFIKLAQELS